MERTRRKFLRICASLGAMGLLSWMGIGCSGDKDNRKASGTVTLNLDDYPALAQDNSSVSVEVTALKQPLLVTHLTGETYYALSSRCTHHGCTVAATTPTLNCPCHDSHFNRDGSVAKGPAKQPLKSFPITKEGNILVIELG